MSDENRVATDGGGGGARNVRSSRQRRRWRRRWRRHRNQSPHDDDDDDTYLYLARPQRQASENGPIANEPSRGELSLPHLSLAPHKCSLKLAAVITGALIAVALAAGGGGGSYSQGLGARRAGRSDEPASHQSPASNEKPFASIVAAAVLNAKVSLACDISPPAQDDSVALVLWYKDDSLAPIYTVDARKASSLDKAKTSVDDHYAVLERVQRDDEADYRCRVDFRRGRTVNTIISLRVIVPPDDVFIYAPSKPHLRLVDLIGPFDEGRPLELVCAASGGRPRPQLSWTRDYQPVAGESQQSIDKNATSVALKINSLNKSHLLSIFTCQATNSNLTQPLQASITLDLNLKPQEISLRRIGNEQALIAGQSATFECLTHGSRPKANVYWLFDGKRVDAPMNVDQQQTWSRLTLTLERLHNQRPLTCVAENPRMSPSSPAASLMSDRAADASISEVSSAAAAAQHSGVASNDNNNNSNATLRHTLKLDVHYPPQLSIHVDSPTTAQSSASQSVAAAGQAEPQSSEQEGNDIYLTCRLDANPRPSKPILWRFVAAPAPASASSGAAAGLPGLQQQPPPQSPPQSVSLNALAAANPSTIVLNNQTLVLRKATRHQSGEYTCESQNAHGSSVSEPVVLRIRHAPVCASSDILVYETSQTQAVELECNVLANPSKSVHFSWFVSQLAANSTHNDDDDDADADADSNRSSIATSSWLQRDAALDEQIDESSARLRLKLRDGHVALVKCKAKNEIGLQQRPCLFELVRATRPILAHTCSTSAAAAAAPDTPAGRSEGLEGAATATAAAAADTIEVVCAPNEHLKSEPADLRAASTSADQLNELSSAAQVRQAHAHEDLFNGAMRNWLSLDAIRAPKSTGAGATPVHTPARTTAEAGASDQSAPSLDAQANFRLVYPPAWLLVELYELHDELGGGGDRNGSQAADAARAELVAYVVVGSASQLGRIKQIVESSGLLSANPRAVYYVMARPSGGDAGVVAANPNEPTRRRPRPAVLDPSSQLPMHRFTFRVPSLKPATRYKLVVFKQNLADRSRDFLVLRAATGREPAPFSASSASRSARVDPSTRSIEQQTGKSLVMRSDSQAASSAAGSGSQSATELKPASNANGDIVDDEQSNQRGQDTEQWAQSTRREPPTRSASADWLEFVRAKLDQWIATNRSLGQSYKELAIEYARQKPLLAIPMLVSALVAIGSLALWIGGSLASSRRRRRRQRRAAPSGGGGGASKGSEMKYAIGSAGGLNDDDDDADDDDDNELMGGGGGGDAACAGKYLLAASTNGSGSSMNESQSTGGSKLQSSGSTTATTSLTNANGRTSSAAGSPPVAHLSQHLTHLAQCGGGGADATTNLVHYCMSSPSEHNDDSYGSSLAQLHNAAQLSDQLAHVGGGGSRQRRAQPHPHAHPHPQLLLMQPISSSTGSLSPLSLPISGSAAAGLVHANAEPNEQVYTIERALLAGPEVAMRAAPAKQNAAHALAACPAGLAADARAHLSSGEAAGELQLAQLLAACSQPQVTFGCGGGGGGSVDRRQPHWHWSQQQPQQQHQQQRHHRRRQPSPHLVHLHTAADLGQLARTGGATCASAQQQPPPQTQSQSQPHGSFSSSTECSTTTSSRRSATSGAHRQRAVAFDLPPAPHQSTTTTTTTTTTTMGACDGRAGNSIILVEPARLLHESQQEMATSFTSRSCQSLGRASRAAAAELAEHILADSGAD